MKRIENELEFAGDKIIRETKAYKGDYPAFSERDLASRIRKRGGEMLESDLIFHVTKGDSSNTVECVFDYYLPSSAEIDYDEEERYPLHVAAYRGNNQFNRGLVAQSTDLKQRQKDVMLLHLEGYSVREIEAKLKIPKSTVQRHIQAGEKWLETEKQRDYDRIIECIELRSSNK